MVVVEPPTKKPKFDNQFSSSPQSALDQSPDMADATALGVEEPTRLTEVNDPAAEYVPVPTGMAHDMLSPGIPFDAGTICSVPDESTHHAIHQIAAVELLSATDQVPPGDAADAIADASTIDTNIPTRITHEQHPANGNAQGPETPHPDLSLPAHITEFATKPTTHADAEAKPQHQGEFCCDHPSPDTPSVNRPFCFAPGSGTASVDRPVSLHSVSRETESPLLLRTESSQHVVWSHGHSA